MADILLTHGYFLLEDPKELEIMKPYPPLGLLCLSAYLKSVGFSVDIHDSTFSSKQALVDRLRAGPPGVVGIYTNLMTRSNVIEIMTAAKNARWKIILGGPESVNYTREYLAAGADVIVIGEGELTLAALLPAIARSGVHRLAEVPGIVFLDETGAEVRTEARKLVEDLDSLPYPDREAIDHSRYLDTWKRHHGASSINLITARGCPYKCNWCSHSVYSYSHRRRSPINVADEVRAIVDRYHPDQLWYADDVFTISHPWLYAYAAELRKRNLHLPFETISRADRMQKEEVVKTLKEMGCYRIWIGSESGSQRILDAMQRGVTVEQVQLAVKLAQKYGIQVGMFLMWGYPGEEMEDIEATVQHVRDANPDVFFTTLAYPIKGTPYFEKVKDRVVAPKTWAIASDRDYQVGGRRGRAYYRHADTWLNKEVAAARVAGSDPLEAERLRTDARFAREAMKNYTEESEQIDG